VEEPNVSNVTKRDISLANVPIPVVTAAEVEEVEDIAIVGIMAASLPATTVEKAVILLANANQRRRVKVEAVVVAVEEVVMVNPNATNAVVMVTLHVSVRREAAAEEDVEAAEDTAAVADAVRTVTIVASRDTSRANAQIRPVRNRSAATTASSRVTSAATVRRLPAAAVVVAMTDFKADNISCCHFSRTQFFSALIQGMTLFYLIIG